MIFIIQRILRCSGLALWICTVCSAHAQEDPAPPGSTTSVVAKKLTVSELEAFQSWATEFKTRLAVDGVSNKVIQKAFEALVPDPDVLRLLRNQPEHARTTGSYVTSIVTPERIRSGLEKLATDRDLLARIEKRFDVPRHVLVAIWGIESRYGAAPGTRGVVRSLATLAAFDEKRSQFWERQLAAALRIVERGDISLQSMTGSWAGAMGHTQFIPTTFETFAVDFDGDGKRDIWESEADALASAANYLRHSGWVSGPDGTAFWGWEVVLPNPFDYALTGRSIRKNGLEWKALGLSRADEKPLPADEMMSLLVPQGARGPAFLVTNNFRVILRYNFSTSYALAVLHLADRLSGGAPIAKAWPTVTALTRTQRMALQKELAERGHDTGGIDGILGNKSVVAIRAEQRKLGIAEDGFADFDLLNRLQEDAEPVTGATQ